MAENGHQLAKAVATATKEAARSEFQCALDWQQYGEKSALLQGLADAIRADATNSIGHYVSAGARLIAAREACEHGSWEDYVRHACLMSPTGARNAMRVAKLIRDRRPDLEVVPTTREVLIELSRDGITDKTIDAIKDRIGKGEKITADDVKQANQQAPADLKPKPDEIIDAEFETKSESHVAPGEYDHDVDRTRQAEVPSEDTKTATRALRDFVFTARRFIKVFTARRYVLADQLVAISDQIRADQPIEGLDNTTLRACLKRA